MSQSKEEQRKRMREYTAMIRRNNPEEIAEYKRKKEEKIRQNKIKYSDKEWRKGYFKAHRDNFPSVIKLKAERKARKEARLKAKEEKLKAKEEKLKVKEEKLKAKESKKLISVANKKLKREKTRIRSASSNFCRRNIAGYNGTIHNIHHIFGWSEFSFIILFKKDHILLHKKYGFDNDNISWYNEKIRDEVLNLPCCLVINKNIVKNNLF